MPDEFFDLSIINKHSKGVYFIFRKRWKSKIGSYFHKKYGHIEFFLQRSKANAANNIIYLCNDLMKIGCIVIFKVQTTKTSIINVKICM